jgi:GAF domain-containing protein
MVRVTNAVQTGEPYWAEDIDGSGVTDLTACIPLRRHGAVMGVLVLFRLLPQKFELHETDRELLRLLEAQLAMALYCAELHEKRIVSNEVAP